MSEAKVEKLFETAKKIQTQDWVTGTAALNQLCGDGELTLLLCSCWRCVSHAVVVVCRHADAGEARQGAEDHHGLREPGQAARRWGGVGVHHRSEALTSTAPRSLGAGLLTPRSPLHPSISISSSLVQTAGLCCRGVRRVPHRQVRPLQPLHTLRRHPTSAASSAHPVSVVLFRCSGLSQQAQPNAAERPTTQQLTLLPSLRCWWLLQTRPHALRHCSGRMQRLTCMLSLCVP